MESSAKPSGALTSGPAKVSSQAGTLRRILARCPRFTPLAGISLAMGWAVPTIYEVIEQPTARIRFGRLDTAAAVVLVATVAATGTLFLLSGRKPVPEETRPSWRFGVRRLLIFTGGVGVLLGLSLWFHVAVVIVVIAAGSVLWSLFQHRRLRARMAALVSCLFCPFVWMIAYSEPFGRTSGLAEYIPVAPSLLIGELIRVVTHVGRDDAPHIAGAIVVAQLLTGVWLVRATSVGSLVFTWCCLAMSAVSSLLIHALYRA